MLMCVVVVDVVSTALCGHNCDMLVHLCHIATVCDCLVFSGARV